jgi:hypothetical protein
MERKMRPLGSGMSCTTLVEIIKEYRNEEGEMSSYGYKISFSGVYREKVKVQLLLKSGKYKRAPHIFVSKDRGGDLIYFRWVKQ